MHLIVVGGVAAGAKAAAKARRVNRDIAITLFQDESEVSYTACGQPYYLSGLVPSREALIIRRASEFKTDGIEVHLRHRVVDLSTEERVVKVRDLDRNRLEVVPYDRLILATGARPVIPAVPGNHLDGVVTLRTMAELDRFRSALDRLRPKDAVIVGAGYIGLEVAESLHALGVTVTIVERLERLFPRLDPEMGQWVHDYLIAQGVRVIVDDGMAEITENAGRVAPVVTASGRRLPAELVVLAIGIRPNVELAEQGGIALGPTGAIAVDPRMETNVKGVFAAGDCAESFHRLTRAPLWEPLGDIANLQGRVAGENAAGGDARFPGVLGTGIFKTFDLNVGLTGLSEATAREAGLSPIAAVIGARDKARYYPGARELTLKLVAESGSGRLLGAQAVGLGAVDKMIDIAATALLGGLSCRDLENADLAYAPPFSPVLSPIIVAASTLSRKLS
ncbi:MAG: FAD-dependent oxidoreductase [Pseudomonadota bacterium]|nr:FAD-dependent oxidoreductase [Pseudomonadota bacterium]